MSANKLPDHYENPIDVYIYRTLDIVNPFLLKLGFTPNMITTISFALGIASIYFFRKNVFIISGILFFLSYYFDCADGNFARRYNMVTTFGDWYDHLTDIVVFIGIIYVVIINKKINLIYKCIFLLTIFFLLICLFIHLAHQEGYYRETCTIKQETSMMDTYLNKIFNINGTDFDNLQITRYLGPGTFSLMLACLIMGVSYFHPK